MKIKLTDFQILEGQNTLEFPEGITMITGSNASGKSSIFYAIINALSNPNGVNDCINHNHNKCEVTIENNNNSLTWTKTQTSSEYRNNKTQETSLKASKLDARDICDLGFYFDNNDKIVNIHDEWSVLFPYGESDSNMFRLFEDIFNVSSSFQVVDEIKKDEQSIKSAIVSSQSDMISLQHTKTTLRDILGKVDINQVSECIDRLKDFYHKVLRITDDYNKFSRHFSILQTHIPNTLSTTSLLEKYNTYESLNKNYMDYASSKRISLQNLDKLENISDIGCQTKYSSLATLIEDYNSYFSQLELISKYKSTLTSNEDILDNLSLKLKDIKVCPTCGQEIKN